MDGNRFFIRTTIIAAGALLSSCATFGPTGPIPPPSPESVEWKPLARSVEIAELRGQDAAESAWGIRVDLNDPAVEIVCTPDNGGKPGDTDGLKTSTFAAENGLAACVNGSPYREDVRAENDPMDIVGLYVYEGRIISPDEKRFPAVAVVGKAGEGRYRFRFDGAPVGNPGSDVEFELAGFRIILAAGDNRGIRGDREARTAIGVSGDGRYLFLFVVDGRAPGRSIGLTSEETAEWMRALGASDGILMDGGGSTALAVRGPEGTIDLANSPRDKLGFRREQIVANHFGIRVNEEADGLIGF